VYGREYTEKSTTSWKRFIVCRQTATQPADGCYSTPVTTGLIAHTMDAPCTFKYCVWHQSRGQFPIGSAKSLPPQHQVLVALIRPPMDEFVCTMAIIDAVELRSASLLFLRGSAPLVVRRSFPQSKRWEDSENETKYVRPTWNTNCRLGVAFWCVRLIS